MKAYNFSLKFMDYVNFVLTPDFDYPYPTNNNEFIEDTTIDTSDEVKYENKYLEEFKKLNKEFILEKNEEEIKKNMYIDFVAILNEQKVEAYLNRLREIEEQLSKHEKSEDECCVSNIECEHDTELVETTEERIKSLLKEKETILFDYNKQNEYLNTQECKEEITKEALTLATNFVINKRMEKLKNCYVMEKTPLGNVLMIYNTERSSFSYYSDSNIPYRYLETVARKYVKMFNCRPIFVDMDEELKSAEEKWEVEKDKQEEDLNNLSQKVEQKKSVFAKFKSYNKDSIATKAMVAPPKNSIPNKRLTNEKENEKMLLKDKSNRYTYEGKFANFNFLKKVDRKVVDKKYVLTFADFKKLRINK
jgi:hypothetical protein